MCFCTFENVKKVDFVLLKMDFFGILTHCELVELLEDLEVESRNCLFLS